MIINIENKTKDFKTYRSQRVKSLFNPERGDTFKLEANIDVDNDWQLGLVVGASGTGKTSIGKKILGSDKIIDLYDNWDNSKPIIDCIGEDKDFNLVTGTLAGVGLGDVPSWLRPFKHLSNGQQFRAGLAKVLCSNINEFVIDEFTSVVDRQIAKIGAMAFAKSIRRQKEKRAILLSCHYDIIEWLQPDWVFDTVTGQTKKKRTSENDQTSNLTFSRSTVVTGNSLKSIII